MNHIKMKYGKIIFFLIFALSITFIPVKDIKCQSINSSPQLGKAPLKEVIAAMTLEEKAALVVGTGLKMGNPPPPMGNSGNNNIPTGFKIPNQPIPGSLAAQSKIYVQGAVGRTLEIPRLGVSTIEVCDGPAGVNLGSPSTAYPIATSLASTWDRELVYEIGRCMGNESLEYGLDLLLAPAMNIHRNPLTGRNFEYYSEDPFLSGKIGAAMVDGIQSQGVGTSVKHFAANNQEANRIEVDAIVSERALREMYLRGFEITVKESDPWTLMAAYNSVNGALATENYDLLTTIARNDWGYHGLILSDWEAGKDPVAQMKAGMNLIMPGPYQDTVIVQAVKEGKLSEKVLDQNIEWILKTALKTQKFKKYEFSKKPDLEKNAEIARKAAADGMVLLKNENNTLPIIDKTRKIAVFGNGSYETVVGGSGSGFVMRAGPTVNIIDGFVKADLKTSESLNETYSRFIKENTPKQNMLDAIRGRKNRAPEMEVSFVLAEKMAEECDYAVITITRTSGETADRKLVNDFNLSEIEKSNLKIIGDAFHSKNKKVVVLMNIGGVVETASWKSIPDAILIAWQPGQVAGNAVADVVTGKVNPSGKLTATFPVKYEDEPSAKNFPGTPVEKPKTVVYEEGIYVGYRYYTSFNVKTSYPFGFGLSYTSFKYDNLKLSSSNFKDSVNVEVTITNTGKAAGKEVVQLYISAPGKVLEKPMEELKGFAKTKLLQPDESQTIQFKVDAKNLASFDSEKSAWMAEKGKYTVKVGASSEDIKLEKSFSLKNELLVEKVSKALVPKIVINELTK